MFFTSIPRSFKFVLGLVRLHPNSLNLLHSNTEANVWSYLIGLHTPCKFRGPGSCSVIPEQPQRLDIIFLLHRLDEDLIIFILLHSLFIPVMTEHGHILLSKSTCTSSMHC
jgi:hypothetical protein